ncbi:hypothetical protein [Nocardia abscessus]|uniref:hypothetical protein n=1 Tax=Nocardia abscessus TaxID=120957 RepID=UPI002456EC35|nr:hypothetical protein [Nocardia abscessus]
MSEEKVVREAKFRGHEGRDQRTPPDGYEAFNGDFVKPEWKAFVQMAMEGKLPTPENVPPQDPKVVALAQELMVIHLPEWIAPNGRKLGGPTSMQIGGALRLADYLIKRGIEFHPDNAVVRWVPTPGVPGGAGDLGKHIWRNDDGSWPEIPDAEEFWDIDDIEVKQLNDGRWCAFHPRGIECTDPSKTEAFAMCVERVRAKVAELKGEK